MKKLAIASIVFFCTFSSVLASNIPVSNESWNETKKTQNAKFRVPNDQILRVSNTNGMQLQTFVRALCQHASANCIFDKSVSNQKIVQDYSNRTVTEILTDVFEKYGLKCRNLSDNILLIESPDAQTAHYPLYPEVEVPERSLQSLLEESLPTKQIPYKYGLIPPPPPPALTQYQMPPIELAGSTSGSNLVPPPPPMNFGLVGSSEMQQAPPLPQAPPP
ncbi:MAG: hypothetical protein K2Y39_15655, partial [Candidatus Obscuribacterales bacterium]|nr:hypothetical protein [Candidatus Obscuribacterales bacterium]